MRILVLLVLVLSPVSVQADILHLRSGIRHHGTLIQQTDSEVIFRIERPGASLVEHFPAKYVTRIEFEDAAAAAEPDSSSATKAPAETLPDYEQMLREAYELLDDQDLPAALRALQYLVNAAPDDVLTTLDVHARQYRGVSLASLAAGTRMRVALSGGGLKPLDLKTPTRYEAAALGEELAEFYEHILAGRYDSRPLSDWAADPAAYDRLRFDARRLAADARLAAAAVGARVRWDPTVQANVKARRELVELRDSLTVLVAHVHALPGFTSLGRDDFDADDPTLIAAERLAQEQAAAATQPATDIDEQPDQ